MNESEKDNQEQLQPQLRFKGFTQPWEQRQLRDIYHPSKERNDPIQFNGDRIISVANMHFAPKSMRKDYLKTYNIFRVGDIAFEGHKNDSFEFGRFVENDIGDGIVSHVFSVYRPNDHSQDIQFWKYLIHNETVMRNVLRFSTISATMMRNLVPADFEKRSIAVPSSSEQKQIGTFLKTLDSLISAAKRKETLLELKKQAYLQQMFPQNGERQPQLRFPGFTGEWEQRQLGELAQKTGSGGTPSSRNPEYYGGDIPFLSIADIQGRTVNQTQKHLTDKGLSVSAAWVVPAGSITFSMYASYGKVAILGSPMATSQAFFNLVFNDSATRDFIFSQLESFGLTHKWDRIVSTGTQPNLTASDLKQTLIALPSLNERTRIGTFFSTLDSLISTAENKVEALQRLKQGYMQKMFV